MYVVRACASALEIIISIVIKKKNSVRDHQESYGGYMDL